MPQVPGFPLVGIPLLPEKLACPPMSLLLFCPKNVDFIIFRQFLAILSPPHKLIPNGKP